MQKTFKLFRHEAWSARCGKQNDNNNIKWKLQSAKETQTEHGDGTKCKRKQLRNDRVAVADTRTRNPLYYKKIHTLRYCTRSHSPKPKPTRSRTNHQSNIVIVIIITEIE